MAQKVLIQLTDDIDPTKEADETVSFALDGTNYEIDLTSKNADTFRGVFQDYIAAGRKVTGKSGKPRKAAASGPSAADVREWAKGQGLDVPDRGRITAEVKAMYEAAH